MDISNNKEDISEVQAKHLLDALTKADESRSKVTSIFSGRHYEYICSENSLTGEGQSLVSRSLRSIKTLYQWAVSGNVRKLDFKEITEQTKIALQKNWTSENSIDKIELANKFKELIDRYDNKKVNWAARLIFPERQNERDALVTAARDIIETFNSKEENLTIDPISQNSKRLSADSPVSVTALSQKSEDTIPTSKQAWDTFFHNDAAIEAAYSQQIFDSDEFEDDSPEFPLISTDEDPDVKELEEDIVKVEADLSAILQPGEAEPDQNFSSIQGEAQHTPPSDENWEETDIAWENKISQLTGFTDKTTEETISDGHEKLIANYKLEDTAETKKPLEKSLSDSDSDSDTSLEEINENLEGLIGKLKEILNTEDITRYDDNLEAPEGVASPIDEIEFFIKKNGLDKKPIDNPKKL